MTAPTCGSCERTTAPGTTLCGKCVTTLDHALANIPAYWSDLDILRGKRTRYATGGATKGSVGKEQPMPLDARFASRTGDGTRVVDDTRNTITTWARTIIEEHDPIPGPTCPACLHVSCHELTRRRLPRDTIGSVCAYIAGWRHWIATEDWGPELLDELLDVERRLRRMIDRPADGWYAGLCGSETDLDDGTTVVCTRELYADPGSPFVRCRDCGCTYDTAARRTILLAEAEDREVTVRTMTRIATTLGGIDASESRLDARIRTWVARGKISAGGTRVVDGRPRPVYRVGDVLDRLTEDAETK